MYLMFVAISTVFWLLNELNYGYTTTIEYPVRFANLPNNKSLVNDLPSHFNLTIKANGYTLMKYKLTPAPFPVVVDIGVCESQKSDEKKAQNQE